MIYLLAALGVALGYLTGSWLAPMLLVVVGVAIRVIAGSVRSSGTPSVITRVPTAYEQDHRPRSRWLYGLFFHLPVLPFLSVGVFRWRGRK